MEITRQKETSLSNSSHVSRELEVPYNLSRQKAIQYLKTHSDVRGGLHSGKPQKNATDLLFVMFMKIGGMSELPSDKKLSESYLNDFWKTLYLLNNLCPADIPFTIIIEQFTIALVQGTIERKGNNQSAICTAFNKWIVRSDVRNRLYEIRNRMYPKQKPKELSKNATPETVKDYSDDEILQKIRDISPMKGLKMVDMMVEELEKEAKLRGLTLNKG
jgi:hypothetical protein